MYFGTASEATAHFHSVGFPCPPSFNPSDFFLDLISIDRRTAIAADKSSKRIKFLAEAWSTQKKGTPALTYAPNIAVGEGRKSKYAQPWLTQFLALTWRAFAVMKREKASNIARLSQVSPAALVCPPIAVILLQIFLVIIADAAASKGEGGEGGRGGREKGVEFPRCEVLLLPHQG